MARAGNNHKGGATPFVDKLGVSQIVREAMAKRLKVADPEGHIIDALIDIYTNEMEPTNNRLAAIKLLAAYLWGNPKTMIEAEVKGNQSPIIVFSKAE